ncbi:MAG TPA: DapH/DapD/GlmU-related protein [Candidatus Bathyarchaeia archaeon]|nr:DapH/DapD/GlmU-related protein [Candidatus Bathyarchaeia archaeon]
MRFISRKARVKGILEGESVILGPCSIGNKSLIGLNVIVGYPVRKKVQAFPFSENFALDKFDRISAGAKIGDNCIIRSGTIIYEDVVIGNWVETGHNVLIREGSTIGDKTRIGTSVKLDGVVKVGKNVSVQSNVYLPHLTEIENDVFLGPNVVLTNDPYPPSRRRMGILVEKGAVIGANACIVVPAKIGARSVVCAGALVTKDVPSGMVVLGAPAKPYITRDEYDRKTDKWEEGAR